jgi:hypothetical protein
MWRPERLPTELRPAARAARAVTIAATALLVAVVTRARPWTLFAREGFTADFYDEQARSFLRFRLDVRPEVAGIEGFVVDGATQLYYGPFLAFVRLPTALVDTIVEVLGGGPWFAGRLARLSIVLAFVAWCTASFHLLRTAHDWFAPGTAPTPWRAAGFVGAVACSPALALGGWVSVYHETELWAAALALTAAVATIRTVDELRHDRAPTREPLVAGVALLAAVLTRASVGIGAVAGVVAVIALLWMRSRRVDTALRTIGLLGVGGVALHVAVNLTRFGSPLSIPAANQQLTLVDPERAAWFAGNDGSFFSPRFLETTVVHYLRPDTVRFERLAPWVRFGPLATDRGSYPMETITPAASLTASATVLFVAAVVGLVVLARRRSGTWLALWAGACVGALPTFTIGFIGNRYLVDLLPALVVPAAATFAVVALPVGDRVRTTTRTSARIVLVLGIVWGAWVNTALAIWTQQLKEPGFTEFRYRLDERLFDAPSPALVVAVPGGVVPRDGVVGIVTGPDGCTAVSITEQGVWVPLERSGPSVLTGTVTDDGILATGDGWQLVADDGATRLLIDAADPIGSAADAPPVRAGDTITVVDDPLTGQFLVRAGGDPVDGALVVFRFGSFGGAVVAGTALTPTPVQPSDSLCRALEARR